MKVREFIKVLQDFEDQDAVVLVLEHSSGKGCYDQGGNTRDVNFDKNYHFEYTDFRGNPHIEKDSRLYNKRELLIGSTDN